MLAQVHSLGCYITSIVLSALAAIPNINIIARIRTGRWWPNKSQQLTRPELWYLKQQNIFSNSWKNLQRLWHANRFWTGNYGLWPFANAIVPKWTLDLVSVCNKSLRWPWICWKLWPFWMLQTSDYCQTIQPLPWETNCWSCWRNSMPFLRLKQLQAGKSPKWCRKVRK